MHQGNNRERQKSVQRYKHSLHKIESDGCSDRAQQKNHKDKNSGKVNKQSEFPFVFGKVSSQKKRNENNGITKQGAHSGVRKPVLPVFYTADNKQNHKRKISRAGKNRELMILGKSDAGGYESKRCEKRAENHGSKSQTFVDTYIADKTDYESENVSGGRKQKERFADSSVQPRLVFNFSVFRVFRSADKLMLGNIKRLAYIGHKSNIGIAFSDLPFADCRFRNKKYLRELLLRQTFFISFFTDERTEY
jgi:hypothetical protein